MLPMRLLRALRKSGGSRAKVGRKSAGGSDPVFVLHRSLRGRTPLRCKGPPGPFSRLRRGPRWLRHPCPVLRALLRLRVLFCGPLCDSGIRTLSCARHCGCVCFPAGSSAAPASAPCPARVSAAACAFLRALLRLRHVCFAAVPSAARAAALQSLLCLLFCGPFVQRGADAAFFAPCGPRLRRVSRIGGPASRLSPAPRYLCSSGWRTGPPGPVPPTARAAPHSGRRRGIAALPGLFRFGGRCESSVIIRKCAGDGIVE